MAPRSTRERILDAAERLFAEQGISGTPLRALTAEAGVNLAAVHYHFGSKERLLDAVVERRARPVNEQRLRELEVLEEGAGTRAPEVEEILTAFLAPGVRSLEQLSTRRVPLARLIARIEAQPPGVVEELVRRHFGAVGQRFVEALQRALPELPQELVSDRFRFGLGVLSYLFSGNFDLDTIPGHPPHALGNGTKVAQVITFLAAGLRAPALDLPVCLPARPAEGGAG
ncbi:MAG: TetR/AcrR family transcriptional regulator [Myxococcota bacterium]